MNSLVRKLYYSLPVNLRYTARRVAYLPIDLFRDRKSLVPPKGKIFIGRGDFLATGEIFFKHFKKYGNLTPQSSILDIGSGIGRMAIPFTNFLDKNGFYEGFDIVKQGVEWCNKNISTRYPNFNFTWIPLKNELYNASTNDHASKITFPYPDNYFNFVFLTSVFTHMLPEDVENYIKEINRVLKTDGICFATFFILDNESQESMSSKGTKNFKFDLGNYSLMDKTVKEANVAYKKEYIFEVLKTNNLDITYFIRGNWSGIYSEGLDEHQDIIIFKKNEINIT